MAKAMWKPPNLLPEFRAPPPSPVAGGPDPPGGAEDDDDDLAGFITRSVRVPELVLPGRILHRTARKLPEIDLLSIEDDGSIAAENLRSTAASLGCFQLMNHGISSDLLAAAGGAAAAVFRMSLEEKREVLMSSERRWGFEIEGEEEEEEEGREEFFWWRGRQEVDMAGNWHPSFKDFSAEMDQLSVEMEKVVGKVEHILVQKNETDSEIRETERRGGVGNGSVLFLLKHGRSDRGGDGDDRRVGSLKHDVVRMLIRGVDCSHSLGLHICGRASRFNVYTKRGCMPFLLSEGGAVVTVGDQIQGLTGGHYKHVIGKPELHGGSNQNAISISLLYSNLSCKDSYSITTKEGKTLSLSQQIMIATSLVLFYQCIFYIYANLCSYF